MFIASTSSALLRAASALAFVSLLAAPASAVPTATFEVATFAQLNKGKPDGTLVSSEGEVVAGKSALRLKNVKWPMVFSHARIAETVYFGTGDPATIVAARGDKVRVVADLKTVLVSALAAGEGDTLYAATLPGAKILEVNAKTGKWRQLAKLPAAHVWALLYDRKARRIFAASGSPGKVYSLSPAGGKPSVYYDPGEKHLLCLTKDPAGHLLVGSSGKAILYRVTARGRGEAVHDFDATEVRDVVVSTTGTIYVGVNKFKTKTSGLPRYDRTTKGKAGTPLRMPKKRTRAKVRQSELRPGAKVGQGALFRVDTDGRVEQLLALSKSYFTDLALDAGGQVWAADGTEGKIYLARRDRSVLTAYDMPERQVLALAVSGKAQYFATGDAGAIYRVKGRPAAPSYTTSVLDAKFVARWGTLRYRATGPIAFRSRSGNTAKPDPTWRAWKAARVEAADRVRLKSEDGRYLQVQAIFKQPFTMTLRSLRIFYHPQNQRTRIKEITVAPKAKKGKPRQPILEIKWKVDNPDKDPLIYRLYHREEKGVTWQQIHTPAPIRKTRFEWNTESMPDGVYRIKVEASDEGGNGPDTALRGHRLSSPVLVDNRKPAVIGLTVQLPWVSGMARDTYSTIATIEYSIDGRGWHMLGARDGIFDTPTETFRFRLPRGLRAGPHIVSVRAKDAAGNLGVRQLRFVQ